MIFLKHTIMKRFNLIFACIWLINGLSMANPVVSDFALNAPPPDTCLLMAPQNLHFTGQTYNSVTLAWDNVPGALSYQVNVAINGLPTMATMPAASNSYTYFFSTPFDFLDFKVRALCANNTTGPWSALLRYDVVIVVDEVTQRPTPCTLPQSFLTRNAGTSDVFSVIPPQNGSSANFLHMEVKHNNHSKDFILWWSDADGISSVRYQNVITESPIIQVPNCPGEKCNSTDPLRFYDANGNQVFEVNPFPNPNGSAINTTINYNQQVTVRFCTPGPGKDRSEDAQVPNEAQTLEMYPNPVDDLLSVSYALEQSSPVTLYISDISGRMVQFITQNELQSAGQYQFQQNVSSLNPGVYYLTLQSAQGRTTRLIMKQ
jgi:hypothetical protein